MNKANLVAVIAEKTGLTKVKATEVLNTVIDQIQAEVAEGGRVNLVGLGVFEAAVRTARKGHNPLNGEALDIPAQNVVRFKASKNFKQALN